MYKKIQKIKWILACLSSCFATNIFAKKNKREREDRHWPQVQNRRLKQQTKAESWTCQTATHSKEFFRSENSKKWSGNGQNEASGPNYRPLYGLGNLHTFNGRQVCLAHIEWLLVSADLVNVDRLTIDPKKKFMPNTNKPS